MKRFWNAVGFLFLIATSPRIPGQLEIQLQASLADTLSHSDASPASYFGRSVAIDGDTLIVGAAYAAGPAGDQQGAAYIYRFDGAIWNLQAKLLAPDAQAFDAFAESVAISGDLAMVGAWTANGANGNVTGAAYAFARTGGVWTFQARLQPNDMTDVEEFGVSVALAGNTAIIGARFYDGGLIDSGAAYVFEYDGATWSQQAQLLPPQTIQNGYFGQAVSLSGNTVVIGAQESSGQASNVGAAHVFVRNGTNWTYQAKLTPSDQGSFYQFGNAVAIDGDTIAVGAYGSDLLGPMHQDIGAAYVFVRSGTSWSQQAKLTGSDAARSDQYGWSVSIVGDTLVMGGPYADIGSNSDQGGAYVFTRSGTVWTQRARLTAGDGTGGDNFGWYVALQPGRLVCGAQADDSGSLVDAGSAYVYTGSGASWTQQAKLAAGTDGDLGSGFGLGYAVALQGDLAVAGCTGYTAQFDSQGGAYVFARSGATWTKQARLVVADPATFDLAGSCVALWNDTVAVGAPNKNGPAGSLQGALYVFASTAGVWAQQAKILPSDAIAGEEFGWSAALEGDTLAIGVRFGRATGVSGGPGTVYIYTRSGTVWTQQAKLWAADAVGGDQFGYSIALNGDTLVVGAPYKTGAAGGQGAAYVYTRTGASWSFQAKLTGSAAAVNDNFGFYVACDGDVAAIGAPGAQGAAYVFSRANATWTEQVRLAGPASNARFGSSVAIQAGRLLVGANGESGGAGAAYVFTGGGSAWTQAALLTVPNANSGDNLGISAALDGDTMLVADWLDDNAAGSSAGNVRVFIVTPPPCPADLDGNGSIDLSDLAILLGDYGCSGACVGDLNNDNTTDLADLASLISAYGQICP